MPPRRRELCEDDVTRHLVFAFMGFLGRQAEKEDLEEDKKAKIEQAKETLKEAFEIPDDDTLKVSRNLELIFLQNNRREIPVPVEETKEEENESVCYIHENHYSFHWKKIQLLLCACHFRISVEIFFKMPG